MSIVGALLGGWLAFSTGRRNALAHQRRRAGGFVHAVRRIALGAGGIGLLWVATIAEGVLGTMATVALFTLMMDASDPEHAGTDYTLLACVVLVVGMLANLCGAATRRRVRLRDRVHARRVLALLGCLALVWVLDRNQILGASCLRAWRTGDCTRRAATPSQTSATEY